MPSKRQGIPGNANGQVHRASGPGIPIANTPGMFSDEVADLAFSYVVALARQTHAINNGVWEGEWPKPAGMSLKGKVAALVGFGNIGQETAGRLLAAKMQVVAYDPFYKGGSPLESLVSLVQELARWPGGIRFHSSVLQSLVVKSAHAEC